MNGEMIKQNKIAILVLVLVLAFFLMTLAWYHYEPYEFSFSQKATSEKQIQKVSMVIVGDIMLDRNVRNLINKNGFDSFFSGVRVLIKNADISVGNLEGPFTNNPSLTASGVNKTLIFTFDPSLSPALADLGFDVLGLANNHTDNFRFVGMDSTRRYIGGSGMLYYGDPFNTDEISTVIVKNGIRVGFVGFHEFYYKNFDKVFTEISRLRKEVDILVVTPHWGIEYQKEPTAKMVQWAHSFIDNGADAVVGTHTHIVGSTEIYKNKKIYYSLGNFAFDQYFSEETMNGLAVKMEIVKNEKGVVIEYTDVPIRIDREGARVVK